MKLNSHQPEFFDFVAGLSDCPVMAVFRGMPPKETVRLAELAWEIGVTQVEVPIETAEALPSLDAAVRAGAERGLSVGAGTIVTKPQLDSAIKLGAAYGVSPGLDVGLLQQSFAASFPFLPGVSTPSEILTAKSLGLTWVKAFPANVLGASWFAAMKGPFPEMKFVATGGVNETNAESLLNHGASVVGVSRAFADEDSRAVLQDIIRSRLVSKSS